MNLYTKYAKSFSATRQSSWNGWNKLIEYLCNLDNLDVLDLGCGNGRFLNFLLSEEKKKANNFKVRSYTGIDNSEEMLEIAEKNFESVSKVSHKPKVDFLNLDLNKDTLNAINHKFNLVVAFGLMHHIESTKARKELFTSAKKLLSKNGIFVVTFWQFKKDEKFMKNHLIKDLSDNNFTLSFGDSAERFCHFSDDDEIDALISFSGFELLNNFYDDGRNGKMNKYIVLSTLN